MQTGKAPPRPLVLMELPGDDYWETWDQFVMQQMMSRGFISPEDRSWYKIVHSPQEAVDWIEFYYSTYHSMRQVRDTLVIRLDKELRDDHLRHLNESFRDLLKRGDIRRTAPLTQEKDETEILSKPRIAFAYNRQSAGRLNKMILAINRMGQEV